MKNIELEISQSKSDKFLVVSQGSGSVLWECKYLTTKITKNEKKMNLFGFLVRLLFGMSRKCIVDLADNNSRRRSNLKFFLIEI